MVQLSAGKSKLTFFGAGEQPKAQASGAAHVDACVCSQSQKVSKAALWQFCTWKGLY